MLPHYKQIQLCYNILLVSLRQPQHLCSYRLVAEDASTSPGAITGTITIHQTSLPHSPPLLVAEGASTSPGARSPWM